MKDIAIYGFGGFGREVACMLKAVNKKEVTWNLVGFFDDGVIKGEKNRYGEVLGGMDVLNSWEKPLCVVFAIGTPPIIELLYTNIINPNIDFPNIYAPNTLIFDEDSLNIGKGNLFCFGTRISCDVTIGDFNSLNGVVSFGHDVEIGSFNVFSPNTRLSGNTKVGNKNFFGVYSISLQGVKIGNNTRVGANSVLMRNTKDGNLYLGNPAKKIEF